MKKVFLLTFLLCTFFGVSQKVGLVFSGGGATGLAHIGVLKALEENNIPIDYITGTSAGALIGALYASGYSPLEIEAFALSERFWLMSQGELEDDYKYYNYNSDLDADLLSYRFHVDSLIQKSLPTNLINPTFSDFELMSILSVNPKNVENSFDNLFIPFRCVASNISTKESILFKNGPLNIAVRSSMTYPFYISPISVNGTLMYDGGLYNNFPASEMYTEFDADFIIGSNVSYNEPPPNADDLMSQIKNLFSTHSNYDLPCNEGIIIKPNLGDLGVFDFHKAKEAIKIGYETTLQLIDSINHSIERRVDPISLKRKRLKYNQTKTKINITQIETTGFGKPESQYIKNKIIKTHKNESLEYLEIKKRLLNLYQSEPILSIFPTLEQLTDSTQSLNLRIRKQKPLKVSFGGNFSSKSVNTGFLSVAYSDFSSNPVEFYANSYFGNFYGSVKLGFKMHLPTKYNSYIEPIFVMNRWDYFKSLSTFFEEIKPSFLIVNEKYWGARFHLPIASKGKFVFDFKNGENIYDYYQSKNFTNKDTTDFTSMLFYSAGFTATKNNLNRKQFASAGSFFEFKTRFVHAIEKGIPGSTAINNEVLDNTFRNWFFTKLNYSKFVLEKGIYRLGFNFEGYYALKPFLGNYTSTILSSQQYNPYADSKTMFNPNYRANQYIAGGITNIFTLKDKLDLRIEANIFQPISNIIDNNGKAKYSKLFLTLYETASVSLIYHSIVGPIRTTLDYYGQGTEKGTFSFRVSYGFVIFNERGIK